MDTKQFRFLNATSFIADADFLIFFERWNDFGFTNICRITGKRGDLPLNISTSFRVIDTVGDNNKLHGHVLKEYSNQVFTMLPSNYVTVFTDIKGCESILLCLSPSDRELLIKSLNICFPGTPMFTALQNTDAFKKSVLRNCLLENVVSTMKKCQELFTNTLDIRQMILDNLNKQANN